MAIGNAETAHSSVTATTGPARRRSVVIKRVLLGLAAVVVVFAAVVAAQPSDFRVTRTATMSAPPPDVFSQVNDFHNWQAWSPWAKLDPNARATFEGPSSGEGARFGWSGNDQVGEGTMTITESHPSDLIKIRLDFLKPFAGTNTALFTFEPEADQTRVTWTMTGKKNFVCKSFCMFMNMDKMIGGEFEKGLASMKSIVETSPEK